MLRKHLIWLCLILICCFLSAPVHGFLKADEFDRFSQMSDKEKVNYLYLVFETRIKHAANLSYRLESSMGGRRFNVPNTDTIDLYRVFEHRVLNNSYTMRIDAPSSGDYHQMVSIFFDGREGITKNYVNTPDNVADTFFGRIDTSEDPMIRENRYTAWLSGNFLTEFHGEDYFIFSCLMQHKEQWEIELDAAGRRVKLTSPYPERFVADSFDGTRKLILDPQKGFMPLSGEFRWEATWNDRNRWSEERFVVEESLLVDGVWMPIRMLIRLRSSFHPEIETFFRMSISDITHGQVSEADMFLRFPEGTSVVDAIAGVSYRTDARGNAIPSTIQPLYELDPSMILDPLFGGDVPLPESRTWFFRHALTIIGLIIILVALYLAFRKHRKALTR